jgi:predicted RNase H-like HicB family nuclease
VNFTAIIYPDDQTSLLVTEYSELGVASQGETEAAAEANLRKAVELYLEAFPQTFTRKTTVHTLELAHA